MATDHGAAPAAGQAPAPDYDGRRFRPADAVGDSPSARYHQADGLLWAEFGGGEVRRGMLVGVSGPGGVLDFGYSMVTADGAVICGRCHSIPDWLPDGRIRLTEHWERFPPHAGAGISYLEEIRTAG
jgi:hypothetical protein